MNGPFSVMKDSCSQMLFQIYCVFFRTGVVARRYQLPIMISPWFQAFVYIERYLYLMVSVAAILFSVVLSLVHVGTWSHPYVKGTGFISQHLLQSSNITNGLWLIWENLKVLCLFKESCCSHVVLKVPIYPTELVAIIFESKVLCSMHESTHGHSILSWLIYIFFKTSLAVKTKYFFQKTTCSRQFFKVVFHSIWREELQTIIHSFKGTSFFWRISLSHPFFHVGWFFDGAVVINFFTGYMEHMVFYSRYLLRTATFLEDIS